MSLPKLGLNVALPPRTVTQPAQVSTSATAARAAQGPAARPFETDSFETDSFQAARTKPAPVELSGDRMTVARRPIAPPPPGGGLDSGNTI
ncbi:MAG TPA: hypothetical protein VK420_08800 [Longimicrobium sp.]|nr:hypothetical protein [Longimicrobium sp.]